MKRSDLYTFQEGLEMSQMKGAHFTHAVKKNKDSIAIEIGAMEEFKKPNKDFTVYLKELDELYNEHAKKDANGKPKMRNVMISATRKAQQFIIPGMDDPNSEYGKALTELKNTHREVIEAQEKKEEEYQEFLKEESEWKPFMIDLDNVPDDIHQSIMDRIIFMIKDEEK